MVSGHAWSKPICADALLDYPKARDQFSADEDDLTACPTRLESACGAGAANPGACPCSGCQGLQQICPPSLFGPTSPALVYVETFATGSDVAALSPIRARAFPVPAEGPIVTNGRDRALVAGSALSLLDLGDGVGAIDDPVVWRLPSWDAVGGLAESPVTTLLGGWQSPLFSADGERFVASLLTTQTTGGLLDSGAIERRMTQRGGIVSGTTAPIARTVAREKSAATTLVATGESDRLFPLASGHMLAVFSWRGPAPVITDTPDLARRLELHLLVPADAASGPLRYFQDKDLRPAAGDDIPVLARCDGTRREDLDACAYPLPARVLESDVSVGPDGQPAAPREVSCLERDGQGNLVPGCDVDTLRARWEDTQPDTLASASSGLVTARCEAPSVRRRTATGQGDASVELLVGCPAFGERFHPFAPGALLALDHRPHVDTACQASRGPGPFRAVFSRPAFDVVVSDAHGDPVTEAEVGASLVLSVVVVGVDGGTATYEIVSGAGSLDGAGDAVTVPSGEPVDLEPTAEGVIVVRVTLRDADGSVIGVQEIAIAIDGASGCSGNDDGTLMHPCHARLPFPPPQAPGADESRTAPAEAGQGVLLHDRSLRLTEVDLAEAADALPVALSRTYRSAHREDGDGLAGGWHFALDMRLAPVTDGDRSGVADPTWLLDEDLAAGHVFDIAVADGGGRIDTWRHPGTSEVIDTGSGPKWWVWDAAAGRAVAKAFRARVTTYVGPRDSFATLRSYTLLLDDGEAAFERHPYWHADRGFRPNERRFYELSEPNGLRRIFDCKGRLVLVIDAQLREVELVYGGPVHPLTRARRLSAVIDSAGRRWSIDWTVVGAYPRIASITDPFGRRVEYHYLATSQGSVRLAEVRRVAPDADPALAVSKVTRYRYDPTGHLTSVARVVDGKELGRMAVSWDGDRVERQVIGALPDDAETWDFAGGGAEVVVTDGRGIARTYTLAAVAESSEVVVAEAHTRSISDGAPEARREVDAVATTRWTHTPSGLVASMTSPLGRVSTFEYTPEGLPSSETETGPDGSTRTASWRWSDANAQLAPGFRCLALSSMTAVTGALTTYSLPPFDGSAPGRSCQPSEVRMPDGEGLGGQVASRRVRFDYVADGPHRGALAAQTVLEDGVAQATKTLTYPPAAGGPSGFAGKVAEPYIGLPSSVAEDVPRPSQCAPETLTHARTDFTRDGRGNVVRSELVRRTQPLVVTTAWDAADRPVRMVVDPDGLAHATTRRFDDEDRVVEERERVVDDDPSGLLPERAAERELVQRTYYDAAGRRVAFSADGGTPAWSSSSAGTRPAASWPRCTRARAATTRPSAPSGSGSPTARARARSWPSSTPRNSGHANHTSQASPGLPVTPSLDPRWILEATRPTPTVSPQSSTTTAGAGGEVGCVGCDDMHERTERSSRDLEGRVVVFDPGRTDRGDGATRVLVATRYDGLGRVVASDWLDPEGCDGPGTVVRSETRTALTPDDHPGLGRDPRRLRPRRPVRRPRAARAGRHAVDRHRAPARAPRATPGRPARARPRRRRAHDALRLRSRAGRVVSEVTRQRRRRRAEDETRYAPADAACWTGVGPADGAGFDSELARDTDQLGLPAYETEIHHGAGADVTVRADGDALGGTLRASRRLSRCMAGAGGRPGACAERDVRGAVHESRYDGLGGQVAVLTHGADGTIATRMTWRAGVVVRETSETRASGGGATTALATAPGAMIAFARAAVVFPRGEAFLAEAVKPALGASDEPLAAARAASPRYELDAFGHVARATGRAAGEPRRRLADPAGHAFARTTARTVRRDALASPRAPPRARRPAPDPLQPRLGQPLGGPARFSRTSTRRPGRQPARRHLRALRRPRSAPCASSPTAAGSTRARSSTPSTTSIASSRRARPPTASARRGSGSSPTPSASAGPGPAPSSPAAASWSARRSTTGCARPGPARPPTTSSGSATT
ncbi:MAG: hypothetical protein U1F43_09210 [Myxococcota bacterium]